MNIYGNFCCGGISLQPENIEDKKIETFEFDIDQKIKFNPDKRYGIFTSSNTNFGENEKKSLEKEIKEYKKQKEENKNTLKELDEKIKEIDEKLKCMEEMIYIDAAEMDFITKEINKERNKRLKEF